MKPLKKIYDESAKLKIMKVLFEYPEKEFSLSDLSREAKVRKANIGKILKNLKSKGFIDITKLNNLWRIKANQRSEEYKKNKIIYNLNSIYSTELIKFLNKYFNYPKAIILFGSFRKGEDISNSDIDIAIDSSEKVIDHKIINLKKLGPYEKIMGKKIQIHLFNNNYLFSNNNGLFLNIMNGIVLEGFLEAGMWKKKK